MTDAALPRRDGDFTELAAEAARANSAFALTIAIYFSVALAMSALFGFDLRFRFYSKIFSFAAFALTATLVAFSIYTVVRNVPKYPIRFLAGKWVADWQVPKRLLYGLPVLALLPVLTTAYIGLKSSISSIVPFYADPWAAWLDQRIHGQDAWMLLHPIASNPAIMKILDTAYLLWFAALNLGLTIAAFSIRNVRLRSQFLVTYVLCWALLGSAVATLLSSVGPRYYQTFYGEDRYPALWTFLHEVNEIYPLAALAIQDKLLLDREFGLAVGYISALPSLHVAIAGLIAIAAWKVSRWLGLLAGGFAALIFVGSVQLGWHYAIDGYVSLLLLPPIWASAGLISRVSLPRAQGQHT